jgi:serine protease Do
VEETFVDLALHTQDEDEKAFYEARAKGAFGSGFVVVRGARDRRGNEVLIVTNRHVVDLGDRAALELADGSQLGAADIVYSDPVRDVAILRPTTKVPVTHGFAFAASPAKDQQVVIATGFPGLVGRPAYQTTRGYVSNESLRLDESATKLTYIQHTAPIDPGSSGGPLTDEKGHVLGVNTLKVTNREAVGLAVPSKAILETIRRSDAMEKASKSAAHRREGARLACLGFVAELSAKQPRLEALEPMISNLLTGAEGLEAAAALEGDETFDRIWQADSVRAMRIATLVRVRAVVLSGGGPSVLETCNEANAEDLASILTAPQGRFKISLATFDTRELAVRFEQGHWKLAAFDVSTHAAPPKKKKPTPPRRKKA